MADDPLCHILTPVGNMGYGFDEELMHYELAHLVPTGVPTAIILDSGSTDSGPQKLALGSMTCPRSSYYRDLSKLLRLVHVFRVPLIFSSAGGDGADEHVEEMEKIVAEICAEEENKHYCVNAISLYSGIDKGLILQRLKDGHITGCGVSVPPLTAGAVHDAARVVAQVGPEPFVDALEANPDVNVIIGGRGYDPAPYIGFCIYQLRRRIPGCTAADVQARLGGFTHMGKIMECGGHCAKPKSHGAVATVYTSGLFDVRPTAPDARCTAQSVATHALYENARPDVLGGPGGTLHLKDVVYEELPDGKTVRVVGSRYRSSRSDGGAYQFKLEAARVSGFRSIFMGSMTDPILIPQIEMVKGLIKKYVKQQHPDVPGEWKLDFHTYGSGTTRPGGAPGPIFLIAEVLAPTQALATNICNSARAGMIHAPYTGQKATAGNLGFGIGGKLEIETGPCAEFCIYHLMDLAEGEERLAFHDGDKGLVRGTMQTIGQGQYEPPTPEFLSSIALMQKELVKPQPINLHAAASAAAKKGLAPAPPPRTTAARTLADACTVLRSKNAGPYEITLDAIFDSDESYRAVRASGILTPDAVAAALGVSRRDIVWMGWYDPARSFKVTIPRIRWGVRTAAGGFLENDIHGSQEHLGLAGMPLSGPAAGTTVAGVAVGDWRRAAVLLAIGGMGVTALTRLALSRRK